MKTLFIKSIMLCSEIKKISHDEFEFIFDSMIKSADTGKAVQPRLLYTEAEWKKMERLKKIAGKKSK